MVEEVEDQSLCASAKRLLLMRPAARLRSLLDSPLVRMLVRMFSDYCLSSELPAGVDNAPTSRIQILARASTAQFYSLVQFW